MVLVAFRHESTPCARRTLRQVRKPAVFPVEAQTPAGALSSPAAAVSYLIQFDKASPVGCQSGLMGSRNPFDHDAMFSLPAKRVRRHLHGVVGELDCPCLSITRVERSYVPVTYRVPLDRPRFQYARKPRYSSVVMVECSREGTLVRAALAQASDPSADSAGAYADALDRAAPPPQVPVREPRAPGPRRMFRTYPARAAPQKRLR